MITALGLWYFYLTLFGCRLGPADFVSMAGARDSVGSTHLLEYQGVDGGIASLVTWQMGRFPRSIRYWTELDGLPSEIRSQILSQEGRWKVAARTGDD